jgi:5-(carboxyamino)imidazole ribonucleotide mutase
MTARVGIIMGSHSDWHIMSQAADTLEKLGIECETRVHSAHRSPEMVSEYARTAIDRGLEVIIAGAGGAAHLPGVIAGQTSLPVLGVPIPLKVMDGLDSLLSIVQMPAGIPVGTLAIGNAGAKNAALLAAAILALKYPEVRKALEDFRNKQTENAKQNVDPSKT